MSTYRFRYRADFWLCLFIGLVVGLMFVPIHVALSAGIAAVSIAVFFPLFFITIVVYLRRKTPWAFAAALLAAAGLLVPQALFIFVADHAGVRVRFEPFAYLHFSGLPDKRPSSTHTYTSTTGTKLPFALYRSNQPGPRPAVILLHGGGWKYGNYLETGNWPRTLSSAGYTVISLEYSLSTPDKPSWQSAPTDISTAMNYIREHAAELNIDKDRISLLGQSAGGHLALLEAYRAQTKPNAVIAIYPPVDPTYDYKTSRDKNAELDFIGGPPEQYPSQYASVNPMNYVGADAPRTLLIQGTRDDLVHYENSTQLASVLKHHGRTYRLLLLPLTGHSFENQHGGFATQIAEQTVLDFLDP